MLVQGRPDRTLLTVSNPTARQPNRDYLRQIVKWETGSPSRALELTKHPTPNPPNWHRPRQRAWQMTVADQKPSKEHRADQRHHDLTRDTPQTNPPLSEVFHAAWLTKNATTKPITVQSPNRQNVQKV